MTSHTDPTPSINSQLGPETTRECRLPFNALSGLLFGVSLLCALVGGPAASLRAETTNASGATPLNIPTGGGLVISTPGTYYLTQNANVSAAGVVAVNITVSDVTIDLNGYAIISTAGASNTSVGIYGANVSRVTVRNGTVANFQRGVFLNASSWDYAYSVGNVVEAINVTGGSYSGVEVYGGAQTVRRCRVFNMNASGTNAGGARYAIGSGGPDLRVIDCDFANISPASGTATNGIFLNSCQNALLVGNRLSGVANGLLFLNGSTGKYRDNLCAASVTTPYSGGTDAGNN